MTGLILNEQIHQGAIVEMTPTGQLYVWIKTADSKDMHVARGKRFVPFLEIR